MISRHNPRFFLTLILALVILTFLAGALLTLTPAQASMLPLGSTSNQAAMKSDLLTTPVSEPIPASTDTTGIIAMTTVIVVIILIGVVWGIQRPIKKEPKKR